METPRKPEPPELRPGDANEHLEDEALVDFVGEQSFPASDPPGWTLGPDKD